MKIYLLFLATILIFNAGMASPESGETCKFLSCPLNWRPVCGRRGNEYKTFGNRCDFDRSNCFANPQYEFKHKGRCEKNGK
uniref:Putative kazalzinho kazal type serine protease inhibitor n=1 Tax=Rhodnius prolixus TaxID=13249 RepID=R4G7Z5_RHOPR